MRAYISLNNNFLEFFFLNLESVTFVKTEYNCLLGNKESRVFVCSMKRNKRLVAREKVEISG